MKAGREIQVTVCWWKSIPVMILFIPEVVFLEGDLTTVHNAGNVYAVAGVVVLNDAGAALSA